MGSFAWEVSEWSMRMAQFLHSDRQYEALLRIIFQVFMFNGCNVKIYLNVSQNGYICVRVTWRISYQFYERIFIIFYRICTLCGRVNRRSGIAEKSSSQL